MFMLIGAYMLEVRNNFPKRKKLLYVYCKSGLEKFLNPLFFAFFTENP